jgi:DNA polymerase-3 subunit delta'
LSIFEIKYQDRAIERFQQAMAANRLSHAYIFAGPDGVGKSTTASELAQLLLCEQPAQTSHNGWLDSCSQCTSCKLIPSGNHPDLHLIYKELISTIPGKDKNLATELGIDVIRQEVIEKVGLKPNMGKNKVFIILEAHLLNRSAQNALLKTLEEPPPNTYLFLITEQIGAMLPTIRSRSQTLFFTLLPEPFVVEKLLEAGADEKQSHFLSKFSPGKLGRALELYDLGVYDLNERLGKDIPVVDIAGVDDFAQWFLEQAKVLAEKMVQREQAAGLRAKKSETELNRIAIKLIFALTGSFYRDAIRYKLGFEPETLLNRDRLQAVKALAQRYELDSLTERIRELSEAEVRIDANVNVSLVVTDVLNKLYAK